MTKRELKSLLDKTFDDNQEVPELLKGLEGSYERTKQRFDQFMDQIITDITEVKS